MSLSINRHLITTFYDNSSTVKSNGDGLNSTNYTIHKKTNDSLELSREFMEYAGGMQTPLSTENYSNDLIKNQESFYIGCVSAEDFIV